MVGQGRGRVDIVFAAIFLAGIALIPVIGVDFTRARLCAEHREIAAQRAQRAFHDPLTGLANRLMSAPAET